MLNIYLEKENDNEFKIKTNDNGINLKLELKPQDIEIYRDEKLFFYIKLKKTLFNLKINKLLEIVQKEILETINKSSYYFNSNLIFEKIYKNLDGYIIIKVNKGDDKNDIFNKDTKKVYLKFEKLILEENEELGDILRVLINYEIEKNKFIPLFDYNISGNIIEEI
jgi:hypothetical protein